MLIICQRFKSGLQSRLRMRPFCATISSCCGTMCVVVWRIAASVSWPVLRPLPRIIRLECGRSIQQRRWPDRTRATGPSHPSEQHCIPATRPVPASGRTAGQFAGSASRDQTRGADRAPCPAATAVAASRCASRRDPCLWRAIPPTPAEFSQGFLCLF